MLEKHDDMLEKDDALDRDVDYDEAPTGMAREADQVDGADPLADRMNESRTADLADGAGPAHALRPDENVEESAAQLFRPDVVDQFRTEWQHIQTRFVDDPKDAVHGADELVTEVMRSLASTFAAHKNSLDGQWQRGGEVATEELRVTLRRYRSFFNQLLDA